MSWERSSTGQKPAAGRAMTITTSRSLPRSKRCGRVHVKEKTRVLRLGAAGEPSLSRGSASSAVSGRDALTVEEAAELLPDRGRPQARRGPGSSRGSAGVALELAAAELPPHPHPKPRRRARGGDEAQAGGGARTRRRRWASIGRGGRKCSP